MDRLEPQQSFSFEGNISQGWKLWLKHFEFYLTVTEKDGKNNRVKTYKVTTVLLTCIGQKGREIYGTFNFDNPDLQPVNVKLSTCSGSKILVAGKCSLL